MTEAMCQLPWAWGGTVARREPARTGGHQKPYRPYGRPQDGDQIVALPMDATTGQLTPHATVAVAGGPSVLALSPDRQMLYVGHRTVPAISSFRIDPATGGLTPQGRVTATHAPTFLAPDRMGRFLLSAYYQGGSA